MKPLWFVHTAKGWFEVSLPKRLPMWLRQRLEARHAVRLEKNRASNSVLADTLQDHGYPPNPFVAEFESAYGGLEVPDIGLGASWREDEEPAWLFGAHACLMSQAHVHPTGGLPEQPLIPVAYSPNDVIYFLDPSGRAFAQDSIEEPHASLFAANANAMLWRIFLWDEIFYLQTLDLTLEFAGLRGKQLSKLCHLKHFKAASTADLSFWGDAEVIVVEQNTETAPSTTVVSRTKKRLNQIKKLGL